MRIDLCLLGLFLITQGATQTDSATVKMKSVNDSLKVVDLKFEKIILHLDSINKLKQNSKPKIK